MQNKIIINKEQKILTSKEGKVYAVNPSNVGTNSDIKAELDKKQDKLTAGEGIKIEDNVISCENKMKLVATGTYNGKISNWDHLFLLDKNLEPNKMYHIERYDSSMDTTFDCFMTTYYDENSEEVETKCNCMMKAYEPDADSLVDTIISLGGSYGDKRHLIIRTLDDRDIYASEDDTLEVYELPYTF